LRELLEQKSKQLDSIMESINLKHRQSLRLFAFKFIGDWGIVDDIIQEVFIKVFLKLNTLHEESALKSWLYSITANQCKDYLRMKYVNTTLLTDHFDELAFSNRNMVETEVLINSDMFLLKEIIESLPKHYKEPIILYYFYNLTYQKISTILRVCVGTIKVRIYRAKKIIREKFIDQDTIGFYSIE
jgi:RNA polymerase sigma-70 factor, ECF subfamily